ncbi:putative uncharacterized protein DDB_G0290521 [Schistocerca americana]|uniref:putative uncharacterized protein DDB_G0290521 n=1 Tax=Schistocerca americana TaxID=7009 RepID=UPI001F4FAFAB|nr:putative uncharacterized protein DDB_G0290521 [Schistocerca americana]
MIREDFRIPRSSHSALHQVTRMMDAMTLLEPFAFTKMTTTRWQSHAPPPQPQRRTAATQHPQPAHRPRARLHRNKSPATGHTSNTSTQKSEAPSGFNRMPADQWVASLRRRDPDLQHLKHDLVRGGFQPRLPTSLPPPGQQQLPSPLPRRRPVPLMPPAQLHPGAPQVVAPAPAVPLQSPPPSELMDVDPSAGPPSQAVAVQPVLQPLSLGTPTESDTAAPCPAPTQQPSTQRQETLPLFVGPNAPSRPVPEAANDFTDELNVGFLVVIYTV